jgi:hypothetical protein
MNYGKCIRNWGYFQYKFEIRKNDCLKKEGFDLIAYCHKQSKDISLLTATWPQNYKVNAISRSKYLSIWLKITRATWRNSSIPHFPWCNSSWWTTVSAVPKLHDHTQTHHTLQESFRRVIRPTQRPLPDNIKHPMPPAKFELTLKEFEQGTPGIQIICVVTVLRPQQIDITQVQLRIPNSCIHQSGNLRSK